MSFLEDYEPFVQYYGLRTNKDAYFGGKVAFKNIPIFNAKTYGALGDGNTDDSTAIQSAVDAAFNVGGGVVYIPKGVYRLANGIKWHSGVSMYGDGVGKSILKQKGSLIDAIYNFDGGSSSGQQDAVPITDCEFRDFEIDGSAMTYTQPSVSGKGIFILYMQRCKFTNLYIHHCIGTGLGSDFLDQVVMDGIIANNNGRNWTGSTVTVGQSGIGIGTNWKSTEAVTISNSHANNNGNYGFFVESQSAISGQTLWPKGARFTACYAEGNRHGFGNKGSGGTTFTACESNANAENGFYSNTQNTGDTYVGCKANANKLGFYIENSKGYITVTGCTSSNSSQHGMFINQSSFSTWKCEDVVFTGNLINNNGWGGIRVSGSTAEVRNITITGNHILDNGQTLTGFQRQGISTSGTVSNFVISSNWIGNTSGSSTQVYGFDTVNGTATNFSIVNNMFSANSGSGYFNTGATLSSFYIRGNTGYVTYASGTGTILDTQTSVTIAHGLSATPTKVFVSPNSDMNIWSSSLGSTNVTYNRTGSTGNATFSWIAEV